MTILSWVLLAVCGLTAIQHWRLRREHAQLERRHDFLVELFHRDAMDFRNIVTDMASVTTEKRVGLGRSFLMEMACCGVDDKVLAELLPGALSMLMKEAPWLFGCPTARQPQGVIDAKEVAV